jgi:hypothetical protein
LDGEAFLTRLAAEAGTKAISPAEVDAVLDLARVVAHTVERRLAPLSAYTAGLALAGEADPATRAAHVRALIVAVEALTGE